MLSIKLQQLYDYFGIPEFERQGIVAQKMEYIAGIMGGLEGDDTFRLLAKYDFDGSSIDRVNTVWKKLKYGEISRELVNDLSKQAYKPSSLPQVESESKSSTQLATEAVSSVISLPRGLSAWDMS